MPITINIPDNARLTERAEITFQALTKGKLNPDEASTILGALASLLNVKELEALEGRIAALKRK